MAVLGLGTATVRSLQNHHYHHKQQQQQQQQQQHRHHVKTGSHHVHRYRNHKWQHVLYSWSTFLVFVMCLMNPVLPEVIYRVDPLALLAATLRTYQRAGCDSEQLSLSCPRGTSISIELAQYGRAGDLSDHSLCPPIAQEDLTTTGSAGDAVIHSGTEIEVKPPETCTVSGLQYALLQTVVDACQKKRHCKFAANSKTHSSGDPCTGIRKFVEIAYKCRPYEFRSKVACENDNMPLVCNPYSRIAIYSATFGHTERESVQCGHGNAPVANDDSSKPTCLVSYATETVMQICHGRRRCSVTADAGTFGRPCKTDIRMYLKVVYTCIPRKVLKDRYETAPETDEPQQTELDLDQDELYDDDQFDKESEGVPPAPKLQGAIPNPAMPFDFGLDNGEIATSTLLPPLLSRNDNSLEERLQSSAQLLNRIKAPLNREYEWHGHSTTDATTESSPVITMVTDTGTSASSSFIPTTNSKNNNSINDDALNEATTTTTTMSQEATEEHEETKLGNFFLRRKCQMVDDWGPIGLNCTEEDIVTERVEVIGFLVNWLQSYHHIRKHQEQFYLYLIISVAAGVVLCLTLVIGRLTLQKKRNARKNSSSSGSNPGKGPSDTTSSSAGGGGAAKFKHKTASETHLPDSFGDDISDIDGDIDLTSPMPLPSLSSRNETYMTYAPTPGCTYGSLPPPGTHSSPSATTMLMPSSHHGGLLMPGHGSGLTTKQLLGGTGNAGPIGQGASRQQTPPPPTIYTSMGVCSPSVSGTMALGPHMLAPSGLSTVSQQSGGAPSYLSGTMMVPGHHHPHTGTLRRTLIPTSMGLISAPSPPLPASSMPPHSMAGVPPANSVYYDSTMPRNLARGISADNTQYYFG